MLMTANTYKSELEIQDNLNTAFKRIFEDRYLEAIKYFEKVIAKKPHNLIALNNKAVCSIFINETQRAIDTLQDLINS